MSLDLQQEKIKKEKIYLKQFQKICKEPVQQKLIQFAKKFVNDEPISIPEKDLSKLANFLSESKENSIEAILFVNCFSRRSKFFAVMTKVYLWSLKNYEKAGMFWNPCRICIVRAMCQEDCDEKVPESLRSNKYMKYKDIAKDELILNN